MLPTCNLSPLPIWMNFSETQEVFNILSANGLEVRFVGGCVRDSLLGLNTSDIDIATPEEPNRVLDRLNQAGILTINKGLSYGTVGIILNTKRYEITTLRKDVMSYGRKAEVKFVDDWIEDSQRRDFTINSLSCKIDGSLFDPMGGIDDLLAGRVRFIGDPIKRIEEDNLRLLRFFRFFAWYGKGSPETSSLNACIVKADSINKLSGDRLCNEMLKLLIAKNPIKSIKLMADTGVLSILLPGINGCGVLHDLLSLEVITHDDVLDDPILRLAALIQGSSILPEVVSRRLNFSQKREGQLLSLCTDLNKLTPSEFELHSKVIFYNLGTNSSLANIFLNWAIDGGVKSPNIDGWFNLYNNYKCWERPVFPINGKDIIKLGIPSGVSVGSYLKILENWWVGRDFLPSRKELLDKLKILIDKENN